MLQQSVSPIGFISTLSTKGQVTIPVEIRKYLNIATNDKVAFVIENEGEVTIMPARYPDIVSLKGAAGKLSRSLSMREMKKIAYADRFEKTKSI